MATVEVTVCDVCRVVGKETHQYTVSGLGRTAEHSLCDEDAEPLVKYLQDEIEPQMPAQPRRRAPRAPHRVTTIAEIEKMKRQRARKAPASQR